MHLFDNTLLFHISWVFYWTNISLKEFLHLRFKLILFLFVRFFLFFLLFVFQWLSRYFLIKDLDFILYLNFLLFLFFLHPWLFFSYFPINDIHEQVLGWLLPFSLAFFIHLFCYWRFLFFLKIACLTRFLQLLLRFILRWYPVFLFFVSTHF